MNSSARFNELFRTLPATLYLGTILSLAGCGAAPGQLPRSNAAIAPAEQPAEPAVAVSPSRVGFDLYVMSKCPFAVKVEDSLWPVLEQLGNRVDFRIHYISRIEEDGFNSLHGSEEVYGDTLQLCAHLQGNQAQWIDFIQCQNENWREIPTGWEVCATRSGLNPASLQGCVESETGAGLLAQSFTYSLENKIAGSPTIFIDGESYRGGRSASSFARHICARLDAGEIPYCSEIPPVVDMDVTVVSDRRCQGPGCDPARFVSFLAVAFEGARIRELDYSDPGGQALFNKAGADFLPIVIFSPEVLQEPEGFERLYERMERFGDDEGYYYPLGRDWDPAAEICDDGVDNTNDGAIDCDDESCQIQTICRPEQKRRLVLFLMSQCPYGVRTVDATLPVLEHFDNDRDQIDFEIGFIGNEKNGKLTSMHGRKEVKEDIRQLCAQKHYRNNYKFMEYVVCRNADYRSDDWKACAKNGIKPLVIDKCATGAEGHKLLREAFRKANELRISGSPTWLLNNRLEMHGRTPSDIKDGFCAENSSLEKCQRGLADTVQPEAASPQGGNCAD